MKFLKISLFLMVAFFLSTSTSAQQCKQQNKPSKTLYKGSGFYGKFNVARPAKLDYATKAVLFFDAFVFTGVYSFTID